MKKEILLVDDDPIVTFLHRRLVESKFQNNSIRDFKNGLEALEHVKNNPQNFYCIFLDIHMPVMNGWEFLEALEGKDVSFQGEVIILTSSVNQSDRRKALDSEWVRDFLSKPLTTSHLDIFK